MRTIISHVCSPVPALLIVLFLVPTGFAQYVNNQTTVQPNANFNIEGSGEAKIFNAKEFFSIDGRKILAINSSTVGLFLGEETGTIGAGGTYIGYGAGKRNTHLGLRNTFVGTIAGFDNADGRDNSFFGHAAGIKNKSGVSNSFFGQLSGFLNTVGNRNSFFGDNSGAGNLGSENAFFGYTTGSKNEGGNYNSFFGAFAGLNNRNGNNNTLIGALANVAHEDISYATAIGANSVVATSNTIALGRANGTDKVQIFGLGSGGSTKLCRNSNNEVSSCSSSVRYKTNISSFDSGLALVRRLRPIKFEWKDGGDVDIGFGAEDVAAVAPILVTHNKNGEVEGVKYDRLTSVLVNAINEQQIQIEKQEERLRQQQLIIEGLRNLICKQTPQADVCLR